MSAKSLSHIQAIVWDLDGTLYRYDDNFIEACNLAAARTAVDLGLKISPEDATIMARESFRLHGSSFKLFADHGIRYEDFHLPYHAAVDTTILIRNAEMKTGLESLKIPMTILTNASRDWAKKTVDHLEYSHIFGDANLLALEDVGYKAKAHSSAGFEKALEIMGVQASQTLMVEDLARNLSIAKDLGMTTALVHHAGDYNTNFDHVDFVFDNTLELVRTLLGNK